MARIRTIKPEFPQSESMGKVSREARLLFLLLFTVVDDGGRTRAASRLLASLLYPYDEDAPNLITRWLDELESQGCIQRYLSEESSYLQITKWRDHQKIDKPTPSKLPAPPTIREASPTAREDSRSVVVGSGSGSGSGREGNGREGSGREDSSLADSAEYERAIREKYPEGKNSANWIMALHHARELVHNGLATWPELVSTTERYARFIAAGGNGGINHAAHNFFDRHKGNHWQQAWDPPIPPNGRQPYVPPKTTEQLEDEAIVQGITQGKSDTEIAIEIDVPLERVRKLRESQHAEH